jgi:hypothetical protein
MGRQRILCAVVALLLGMIWAPPASAFNKEFFGLNGWDPPSSAPWDGQPSGEWGQLGEARIGTWRAGLAWKDIEPNAPTQAEVPGCGDSVAPAGDEPRWHCYTWAGFDSIVENAANEGIRILPYAVESPSWATGDGLQPCNRCPPLTPEARADWRRFLTRAVDRYGQGGIFWQQHPGLDPNLHIKWVQAWNEPNFNTNWCHEPGNLDCRVSAREYGRLVKDTCNAVNGISTDCTGLEPLERRVKVLLAGLPETFQSDDTRMIDFLRNLYRNVPHVKRYFQGVALHPFAIGKEGVRGAILRAKDVMKTYGGWNYHGRKVPIWATEFGWATDGPPDDDCPTKPDCERAPSGVPFVTDWDGQQRRLKRSYRMLANHTSDYHLARAFWFNHQDNYDASAGTWAHYTGLFFRDEYVMSPPKPKPAWCGYIEVVNEFLPEPDTTPPDAACAPPQ